MQQQLQQYQAYFQQQQQQGAGAPAAQQPQKEGWWKAPEYNPAWEKLLRRNEQGDLVPAPGAPADIVSKYYAWAQHKADVWDRLAQNPLDLIKPGLKEYVEPLIQERIQAALEEYKSKSFIDDTVKQAETWMLQRDQHGNPVRDPLSGQPVLSPQGRLYQSMVQELTNDGIRDQRRVDLLARQLSVGQIAYEQLQTLLKQQGGGAPPAARSAPNHAGSLAVPSRTTATAPAQNGALRLSEMIEQGFRLGSITDEDIRGSRNL